MLFPNPRETQFALKRRTNQRRSSAKESSSLNELLAGVGLLSESHGGVLASGLLRLDSEGQRYSSTQKCQIVRSSSLWSMGLQEDRTEKSIQQAYLRLIDEAKHLVYIENQFFVSDPSLDTGSQADDSKSIVKNKIAAALVRRIFRAIDHNEDFKVVVVLPLLPGFEGGIADKSANVMRLQLGLELDTIERSKNSILRQ